MTDCVAQISDTWAGFKLETLDHKIRYGIEKAKIKVFLGEPDEILEDYTNKLLDNMVIDDKSPDSSPINIDENIVEALRSTNLEKFVEALSSTNLEKFVEALRSSNIDKIVEALRASKIDKFVEAPRFTNLKKFVEALRSTNLENIVEALRSTNIDTS
ncbi:uncharacterized protein [Drosophila kikkawai]|uniref:Uncharacterized protein n=1 Tax=Drosophila kikkawai TaxID=30033 RepID=A0ABM4GI07_DROKI